MMSYTEFQKCLPQPPLILAGLLAQMTIEHVTLWYECNIPLICGPCQLIWAQFLALSVLMAILSVINTSKYYKVGRAALTFFGSLILNMSAAIDTTVAMMSCYSKYYYYFTPLVYTATLVLGLAAVFVTMIFLWKSPKEPRQNPRFLSHLPDSEVLLAGVCIQYGFEWLGYFVITWSGDSQCYTNWIVLVAISYMLTVIEVWKSAAPYKVSRGILTFAGSFIFNLCSGEMGHDSFQSCILLETSPEMFFIRAMFTAVTAVGAVVVTIIFLIRREPTETTVRCGKCEVA